MNERKEGYIYILANASMPGQLKIGKTKRTPEKRAKEMQSTGVPTPFLVAHKRHVTDIDRAEKIVHEKLKACRINPRREFFEIDLPSAIKEIDYICDKFSALDKSKLQLYQAQSIQHQNPKSSSHEEGFDLMPKDRIFTILPVIVIPILFAMNWITFSRLTVGIRLLILITIIAGTYLKFKSWLSVSLALLVIFLIQFFVFNLIYPT